MKNKLIYLAVPYSHPDRRIREQRYYEVTKFAGELMQEGYLVFSPITHSHPIACHVDLPKDFEFWERFCLEILKRCDELWVLCLPGWTTSVGVRAEIAKAKELGMEIVFVNESDEDDVDVAISCLM